MKESVKILSPCGILGYGFPKESFLNGIFEQPDAIVVDAGSTDAGPHKLGAGVSIVSKRAVKKDLELMIIHGLRLGIPVIIGSAGGSGARVHVEWTMEVINEILAEQNLNPNMAIIWADIDKTLLKNALAEERILPLGNSVKALTGEIIDETPNIVAQMGHEPIIQALNEKVDIIVCGRAFDASVFAAVGIYHGFDPGLSYHLGKILECGALSAEPGTTKDCMLGILNQESFIVKSLNPKRKCYPSSVAAHTFYEKDHPYLLKGPGMILNLEDCTYEQIADGVVEVKNSKYQQTDKYYIKLEGARKVAYRTFVIAGVRDPLLIQQIENIEQEVENQVKDYFSEIPKEDYQINFYNYGKSGVMGSRETDRFEGYELGVLFEVVAKTQELATTICAYVRSTFLHYGFEGRKTTAGNLAFPFAPSDVEFGPVYEFSIYHLLEVEDGLQAFTIEHRGGSYDNIPTSVGKSVTK